MNQLIKVFVAHPFSPEKTRFFDQLLTDELVAGASLTFLRPDRLAVSGDIPTQIESQIKKADIVLADMDGLRPNVMYEIGVAHHLCGKGRTILMIPRASAEVPFDLRNFRMIEYGSHDEDTQETRTRLCEAMSILVEEILNTPKSNVHRTIDFREKREYLEDGGTRVSITRELEITGGLFSYTDSWTKPPNRTFKENPVVELDPPLVPDGHDVSLEQEAIKPNLATWRIVFDPPILHSEKPIRIGYSFMIPNSWTRTQDELRAYWSTREKVGTGRHVWGFNSAARAAQVYNERFVFELLFPRGHAIEEPRFAVINGGVRREDVEEQLNRQRAFRVRKLGDRTLLQLDCKPPITAMYYLLWKPAE